MIENKQLQVSIEQLVLEVLHGEANSTVKAVEAIWLKNDKDYRKAMYKCEILDFIDNEVAVRFKGKGRFMQQTPLNAIHFSF